MLQGCFRGTARFIIIYMGGSAFGRVMPRLNAAQYAEVVSEMTAKLHPAFFERVHAPRKLPSKESFGDVDLVVCGARRDLDPQKDLGALASVRNGTLTSLDIKGFQVDLIKVEESWWDLAVFCNDYGDVGMIIGMLVRNLGLKFGMKGLTLKLETAKVKLSQSRKDILAFLGLSEAKWCGGFGSQEEVFTWLQTCRYFRPSFFQRKRLEQDDAQTQQKDSSRFEEPKIWNREVRKRLDLRPMFSAWIQHVSQLPSNEDRLDSVRVRDDALTFFDKREQYENIVSDFALRRSVKEKFNGKLASSWTDNQVVGKDLGERMAVFRKRYSMVDLNAMTVLQIKEAFLAPVKCL